MTKQHDIKNIKKIGIQENARIETSLYNLIDTVRRAAGPDDENLVPSVVAHLLRSGKLKLYCEGNHCSSLIH